MNGLKWKNKKKNEYKTVLYSKEYLFFFTKIGFIYNADLNSNNSATKVNKNFVKNTLSHRFFLHLLSLHLSSCYSLHVN